MCSVSVCRSCGRTKNKDFVYCPWCGVSSVDGKACSKVIDFACSDLMSIQNESTIERISFIEDSLVQLEKELTQMLALHEVEQR